VAKLNLDGWNIEDALLADPPDTWVTQQLFESPDGTFAALLYHVFEHRMGSDIARLAVFKNKSSPYLLLRQREIWWNANASASTLTWITDAAFTATTAAGQEVPIVVVDMERRAFSFIHAGRGDLYKVRLDGDSVSLSATDGVHVALDGWHRPYTELHWFGFDRFADFYVAYRESATFHGITGPPVRGRLREAATNAMHHLLLTACTRPLLFLMNRLVRIADVFKNSTTNDE
jgi:hypothetical protein